MILTPGKLLRFKGRNAKANCDEIATELQGRCKRVGNTLEITKPTRLKVDKADFEILTPVASTNGAEARA